MNAKSAARRVRSTTVLAVRRDGCVVLGADGQVTTGESVLKHKARKIRSLLDGKILAGFAGSVADALTLFDKFEKQAEAHPTSLKRAAVELAKEWRTDRYLRRLDAMLIVADMHEILVISGNGDVIEPDDEIAAIGSGGPYAMAAAKALVHFSTLTARDIVKHALLITSEICIYTNNEISLEEIKSAAPDGKK